MKRRIIFLLAVFLAVAFYFGFLKFRAPSLADIERAMPVQLNPDKQKQITEMKEKTKKAVSAASKELKKKDDQK